MASQRADESRLHVGVDAMLAKSLEIRDALYRLQAEIHRGPQGAPWEHVQEHFSHLQVKISNLLRQITAENMPELHNRVFAPEVISTARDEHLEALTQGRTHAMTHDVVPQYLRTKLIPEMEEADNSRAREAAKLELTSASAVAHVQALNATCEAIVRQIDEHKREYDRQQGQAGKKPTPASSKKLTAFVFNNGL